MKTKTVLRLWGLMLIASCASVIGLAEPAVAASPSKAPPIRSRAGECTETIPNLYDRVSPAVVSITAIDLDRLESDSGIKTVVGSGFIISKDGLVVTNSHVVFDHQAIAVTLDDGRRIKADLLGADPIFDLAVLRITASTRPLPAVVLGDSDSLRIGEDVIAIGNPLGLEQTLTRGVLSGLDRFPPDSAFSLAVPLIQTDAPINPGNSGGPLLNRCGEAIGITTLMAVDAQNIGFAVPSKVVKKYVPQLVEHGRIIRPWFGLTVKPVDRELLDVIRLPLVQGLLVEKVDAGSPAQKAGIREGSLPVSVAGDQFLLGGDIIVEMNGRSTLDLDEFAALADALKVGDTVRLALFRDGQRREVSYELIERPLQPGDLRSSSSNAQMRLK